MPKAVTIVSGGLDSTTLAYFVRDQGFDQQLISFNYGQRHVRELASAMKIADKLKVEHHIVDLTSISHLLMGSSQTDLSVPVPEGHYAQENMKATVVPNRNAIMLSIAYGAAVASNSEVLFYGAHAGDRAIYDDCRPEFVALFNSALKKGNQSTAHERLTIVGPFLEWKKADIVRWGLAHDVPYELTWTCYKGGEISCGRCGTDVERLEAFAACGAEDPIPYEDREYWRKAFDDFNKKVGAVGG